METRSTKFRVSYEQILPYATTSTGNGAFLVLYEVCERALISHTRDISFSSAFWFVKWMNRITHMRIQPIKMLRTVNIIHCLWLVCGDFSRRSSMQSVFINNIKKLKTKKIWNWKLLIKVQKTLKTKSAIWFCKTPKTTPRWVLIKCIICFQRIAMIWEWKDINIEEFSNPALFSLFGFKTELFTDFIVHISPLRCLFSPLVTLRFFELYWKCERLIPVIVVSW